MTIFSNTAFEFIQLLVERSVAGVFPWMSTINQIYVQFSLLCVTSFHVVKYLSSCLKIIRTECMMSVKTIVCLFCGFQMVSTLYKYWIYKLSYPNKKISKLYVPSTWRQGSLMFIVTWKIMDCRRLVKNSRWLDEGNKVDGRTEKKNEEKFYLWSTYFSLFLDKGKKMLLISN
jgi:hypothetical protein